MRIRDSQSVPSVSPNYLYHNKHDDTFEDVGCLSGTTLSLDGKEQGSMSFR